MKDFFRELFEYNGYANQKVITAFLQQPNRISEKNQQLMSHVLNAHHIWNARIGQANPQYGVWEIHPPEAWVAIDQLNHQNAFNILDRCDLEWVMEYTNTKGQAFNNRVRDMLFHVINHSNYHRAQMATEMKQGGIEPVATDFIFYKR